MIFSKSLKKSRETILKAFSFISGKSEISNLDLEAFEDSLIESDIDLENLNIGSNVVTVTDINGCVSNNDISITINSVLNIDSFEIIS